MAANRDSQLLNGHRLAPADLIETGGPAGSAAAEVALAALVDGAPAVAGPADRTGGLPVAGAVPEKVNSD